MIPPVSDRITHPDGREFTKSRYCAQMGEMGRTTVAIPPDHPSLAELLRMPPMRGAVVLAGAAGLERAPAELVVGTNIDSPAVFGAGSLAVITEPEPNTRGTQLHELISELDRVGACALACIQSPLCQQSAGLHEADLRGFPVIQLPQDLQVERLAEQVLDHLLQRAVATLTRSERLDAALATAVAARAGLHGIAAALATTLGGHAMITDSRGRVLAEAGAGSLPHLTSCFDRHGRFRVDDESLGLSSHPGSGGQHIVAAIPVGGRSGRLVAISPSLDLTPHDLAAVSRAATVASQALGEEIAARRACERRRREAVRELVTPQGCLARGRELAAELGWDLDRPLAVVVAFAEPEDGPVWGLEDVPPDDETAESTLAAAWRSLARQRDPGAAVTDLAGEVVVLLGGLGNPVQEQRALRDLAHGVAQRCRIASAPSVSTGVSLPVSGPQRIATGYRQARAAARIGRRLHGPGSLTTAGSLGVLRLLDLVEDTDQLQYFAQEALGPLAGTDPALDPTELADLRHTLTVLLECNLNVAQAARELHFHYNTLRYRIAKLERLVGPFTRDPHRRLTLELALQVLPLCHD